MNIVTKTSPVEPGVLFEITDDHGHTLYRSNELFPDNKAAQAAAIRYLAHRYCWMGTFEHELDEAERKAFQALARYKFQMFGYHAAIWVHLNRISGAGRENPFRALVHAARWRLNPTLDLPFPPVAGETDKAPTLGTDADPHVRSGRRERL